MDETNEQQDQVETTAAQPELEKYIAEFGLEKGVEYYRKGTSFEDAVAADYAELKKLRAEKECSKDPEPDQPPEKSDTDTEKEVDRLAAAITSLEKEVALLRSLSLRGAEPVSPSTEPTPTGTTGPTATTKMPASAIQRQAERIRGRM